jgi:hypothetical protein
VNLNTCGYTGTLSDTRIYGPCANDDNRNACAALGLASGTNPSYQSSCDANVVAAGQCFGDVAIGGYGSSVGCATLNVVCTPQASRHARSLGLDVVRADTRGVSHAASTPHGSSGSPGATIAAVLALVATATLLTVAGAVVVTRQRPVATDTDARTVAV